jgi:hypothetical protein
MEVSDGTGCCGTTEMGSKGTEHAVQGDTDRRVMESERADPAFQFA